MQKRVFLPQRPFLPTGTRCPGSGTVHFWLFLLLLCWGVLPSFGQATVTIDPAARHQVMDGFGTCLSGTEGETTWMQNLYYDDAGCSILRMDLVPRFVSPYSDNTYNSPWFHNNPPLPGPDGNNVRTYTNASDYTRLFNNNRAQIAVMGPDIAANILKFDYTNVIPRAAGAMAKAGASRKAKLGDFKLTASIWSPAPWLKVTSGNKYGGAAWPLPTTNVPFPFIWNDNFTGGKLDVSNTPRAEFFDGVQNTSALTQFARSTAAYVKGFQDRNGVQFYSISIQNELNFETFYNSATYPLSSYYIAALKAVRAEFNKYTDLRNIRIMGPEDLLGGDAYGLWQYGNSANTVGDLVVHKNLQYLTEIAKDPAATAAIDYYCIHGYASDGVSSAGANSALWNWWANGWGTAPVGGIPDNVKGFRFYNKKSWMTETSGEEAPWLAPATGFPNNGAFSVALKMHQAIVNGFNSAWIYWQFSDGAAVGASTLTDATAMGGAAKYNSFKHFSKYIRPNAVRVGTSSTNSGVSASSYVQDTDKSLTVVLINSNAGAQQVTVNVPTTLGFAIASFNAYTSSNNSYWQSSVLTVSQNRVTLTVPAYGVTTLYGTGTTTPPVTLRTPENPASTVAGVEYKYYEGTWSVLPNFDALTAAKSGNVANFDMSVRNRVDNYGFKYSGFVNVPTDGTYTFYTSSDDGSKLFIGTTEVVNNDGLHGLQERSGTIGLKAGKHAISVTFFEATGGEGLTVSYAGPALTKQVIPNTALFRNSGTTTPPPAGVTYISDLTWASATNGHGPVEKDKSNGEAVAGDGRTLTLNGVTYAKGLGVHAASEVVYNLGGTYTSFLSDVGLDDETPNGTCGTAVFEVYLDNVLAYTSGTMTPTTATKSINVNVSGKNQLKLVVTIAGDNNYCDHADWAGARLTNGSARVAAEGTTLAEAVTVYPNPVKDGVLHLKVRATEAGKAVVALSGAAGGRTLRKDFAVRAGENVLKVNTHGLPSGLYFLSVQQGAHKTVKKVVIGN